jgi:inhibitor of KinA sporulation pathway (predicted exonuclease)
MSLVLVVDFEATCDDDDKMSRNRMEIIEIGALTIDLKTKLIVDEFTSLIKPIRSPFLSDFCTKLTGIKQADVDAAPSVYDVFPAFDEWIRKQAPSHWGSWGAYDRSQLAQDCKHFAIASPIDMPYINLRTVFGNHTVGRKRGLANSMIIADIPLAGVHHRAMDDARNIAALISEHKGFAEAIEAEIIHSQHSFEGFAR